MSLYEAVREALESALEDWEMMQKTSGDEGAEWAETFERRFYLFIEALNKWFTNLENPPETIEAAEQLPEIQKIEERLPVPLQLNFTVELDNMIDGIELSEFD